MFHKFSLASGQEAAGKLFHYEVDTVNQVQITVKNGPVDDFLLVFFLKLMKDHIFDIDVWI